MNHDESGSRSSHAPKKKHLPLWQETILLLGVALVLAVVIKTFFVQAFYIPSASMEPGLALNDRILIQKVSYWGDGEPERGDVVVFKDPGGWLGPGAATPPNTAAKVLTKVGLYPAGGHLVKRVIGVAGDTIECCDDEGRITVNGEPLDEPYVQRDPACGNCNLPNPIKIPAGHFFMMGDNRGSSADSREWGPVPKEWIIGNAFFTYWPPRRIGLL